MWSCELRIPTRWQDFDLLGHVNNVAYLVYVEELLGAWLGKVLGDEWVTARLELDYRREIPYGTAAVVARCRPEAAGRSSITIAFEVAMEDGTVALEGRAIVAAWDGRSRRSRPLVDSERTALGVA
jgi:acyl-CoA thioesterase FadM